MKSIYMEEGWGELQQIKANGIAVNYVFEKDGMKISYPFIMRKAGKIEGSEYYDIVTPRGQNGPRIESDDEIGTQEFVHEFDTIFDEYCREKHIVAEYVQFSPWLTQVELFANIYDMEPNKFIYWNDLRVDFFKSEYKARRRRDVRKAQGLGVAIVFDESRNTIDEFLKLYSNTERKYQVSDFYRLDRSSVERYFDMLPGKVIFAKAIFEGKTISIGLILMGKNIAHYHFGASDPAYKSIQGNSLMLYKTALFAAAKEKVLFDLGGAMAGSSLELYKEGLARKHISYRATKIRNKEVYDKLVENNGGPRKNYFPAYRKK
jgi:hypothetical protein